MCTPSCRACELAKKKQGGRRGADESVQRLCVRDERETADACNNLTAFGWRRTYCVHPE